MGIIGNIKEKKSGLSGNGSAIHTSMEVFLYPSFKAMLHYRLRTDCTDPVIFSWPGGSPQRACAKRESKYIREHRSEKGFH